MEISSYKELNPCGIHEKANSVIRIVLRKYFLKYKFINGFYEQFLRIALLNIFYE